MKISVIIVTYNTATETLACLRSVLASKNLDNFEIIVIDNNSSDDTADQIKEHFPQVKLIKNSENRGFAKAVNQGIKISSGKYIFMLNPDAEVEPNTISKLASYLEKNHQVGIVGPKILNFDGTIQRSVGPLPTLKHALYEALLLSRIFPNSLEFGSLRMAGFDFYKTQLVAKLTGAALLMRREVFDAYGLFDEQYFLYYEETDLMLRMHRQGKYQIVFYPDATVRHHLNKSLGATSAKTVNYSLTSMNHYYRKNYGWVYNFFENLFTFLGAITNSLALLVMLPFTSKAKSPLVWYWQVISWYLGLNLFRKI